MEPLVPQRYPLVIKLARLLVPAFLLLSCASPGEPPKAVAQPLPDAVSTPKGQRDLEALFSFFTGTWEGKPVDPPVRMRVVEFWRGAPVRWLYLEWVRPGEEAKPKRQLVFRFAERSDGHATVTVHRLPGDATRFAGEWRKPQPFEALRPADLAEIAGCRMEAYRSMTAHFVLVTEGVRCPSDLPAHPYVRFEFSLASSELDLLEQARDAAGNVPAKSRLEPFRYLRMSREAS